MTIDRATGRSPSGVFPAVVRETHADELTRPFWDAAREGRLVAPRCKRCGTFRLPPAPYCFSCRAADVEWVDLPGTGTVYTYTVVRHPLHPDLVHVCPYITGVVELDGTQGAGARMLANIVDCDPERIGIGTRVEIVFDETDDDLRTPRFHPVATRPEEMEDR